MDTMIIDGNRWNVLSRNDNGRALVERHGETRWVEVA